MNTTPKNDILPSVNICEDHLSTNLCSGNLSANAEDIGNFYEFNTVLRNWIVGTSFFLFLGTIAYFLLDHFSKKKSDGTLHHRSFLSHILCTISLTVCLAAMLLIPITLISHEILTYYPNNYYLQWLERDLIFKLWNVIYMSSNSCLFGIIPFAYFYNEAEGIGRGKRFFAKLCEALVVLTLVLIMLAGCAYMIYIMVKPHTEYEDFFAFSNSVVPSIGALVFLASTPLGFTTLTIAGFNLKTPFITKDTIVGNKETLSMQIQVLESHLEGKGIACKIFDTKNLIYQANPNAKERQQIIDEMTLLRKKYHLYETASIWDALLWNLLSLVLTIVNLLFPAYTVLRVLVHLGKGFWNNSPNDGMYNFLVIEQATQSVLVSLGTLLETTVIVYVMTAAFVGFYEIPWTEKLKPKSHNTSMHKIVVNVSSLLLLSSSFPIVARILGLTSFDLMGYYSFNQYLHSDMFHNLYKLVFMFVMMHQYFKLFPPTYYAYNLAKFQIQQGLLFFKRHLWDKN